MLAEYRAEAFDDPGWLFELKLDGFRMLAERINGQVRLLFRRKRDAGRYFPELIGPLRDLPGPDFILDGEVVIQDAQGHPVFQHLLGRHTLTSDQEIAQKAQANPAAYFAFDLLMLGARDVRGLPLRERKALLTTLLAKNGRVQVHSHIEGEGRALMALVRERQLEGIMCKRRESPYEGGRSLHWLKVPVRSTGDFVVVGHTPDWGSLTLATSDQGAFVYAGRVGSGLNPRIAAPFKATLEKNRVDVPRFKQLPADVEPDVVWVEPVLVVEVRYKSWLQGGVLREPVFMRVREDKGVDECPTPQWARLEAPAEPARQRWVGHAGKLFFPDEGITKGEVCRYYDEIAPWLMPYLVDRPLMLTRYPDGIAGKSFFQKAKPQGAPDFIRTVRVRTIDEDGHARELDQLVCDDVRTLAWCAGMGAIPLHLPAGRASSLEQADWAVIDFDPKDAAFAHVVALAKALHGLCREIQLPAYLKTTGSSGLHVFLPLGRQLDHTGARQLADVLAAQLVRRLPELGTVERVVSRRQGRVYIDTSSNGRGKLIAAPFAVRPLPGAPVSMPIRWEALTDALAPRAFTIRNALERVRVEGDPFVEVLREVPDLRTVVAALDGLK